MPRLPPDSDGQIVAAAPAPSAFGVRVARYGGVGVGIAALYSLAVIGAVRLLRPISPTEASVLAFVVVQPLAYLAHRYVTFADRPYDRLQAVRFAFTSASSFVVAVGGMYWITEIAGFGYLVGIAWNWVVIPAVNFLAYLYWVFRAARARTT